jgi:ribosomal protein S18 acetylase RimI-like enzyme
MDTVQFSKPILLKNKQTVELRFPNSQDKQTFYNYYNELYKEDTFTFYSRPLSLTESESFLKSILISLTQKTAIYLGAFTNGELIGLVTSRREGFRREHICQVGLTVAKQHRGNGIGRALMEEIISLSQSMLQAKLITLDYFANNQKAHNLYKSLGFEKIGEVPNGVYYQGHYYNNVLMCKRL